jgi:hypothetical protein
VSPPNWPLELGSSDQIVDLLGFGFDFAGLPTSFPSHCSSHTWLGGFTSLKQRPLRIKVWVRAEVGGKHACCEFLVVVAIRYRESSMERAVDVSMVGLEEGLSS